MKQRLEFKEKFYLLQHPGNRAWLKLRSELLDARTGRISLLPLLDYAFEHVVFPEEGPKLTVEDLPIQDVEDWGGILSGFFRGDLDADYKWEDASGVAVPNGSGDGKAEDKGSGQGGAKAKG